MKSTAQHSAHKKRKKEGKKDQLAEKKWGKI